MQRVILVVAHDASVRSEVSQALRGEGCLVLAVPDGTMGLDVASHVPFFSFFCIKWLTHSYSKREEVARA